MGKEDIEAIIEDIQKQLEDAPEDDVTIDSKQAQALIECIKSIQQQQPR